MRISRKQGFRPAGALIGKELRHVAERNGFAQTRLLTDWDSLVGQDIARKARPLRVSYAGKGGFGATLVLLCPGATAPEVEMMIPAIREKVNACYGYNAISRIKITQTAPQGFAEAQATFSPPSIPELPRDAQQHLDRDVGDVKDEGLRDALVALGRNIMRYSKS